MMEIKYGCVYKRSNKPVMKGSRVETIAAARKEYKELLEEGWKKTSIYIAILLANPKALKFVIYGKVIFKDTKEIFR